jgi:hypothetical protein
MVQGRPTGGSGAYGFFSPLAGPQGDPLLTHWRENLAMMAANRTAGGVNAMMRLGDLLLAQQDQVWWAGWGPLALSSITVQTVSYFVVLYCTVLYCTVLYCTVLYCTVLYCTVLYCTVLYCTALHCNEWPWWPAHQQSLQLPGGLCSGACQRHHLTSCVLS